MSELTLEQVKEVITEAAQQFRADQIRPVVRACLTTEEVLTGLNMKSMDTLKRHIRYHGCLVRKHKNREGCWTMSSYIAEWERINGERYPFSSKM